MPFVPVPSTAEIEIQMALDSQHIENTLYVSRTDLAFDVTDLEEIANAVVSWWQTECRPLYSDQVRLDAVKVTSLESSTAPVWEQPVSLNNTGTLTSAALPNNVCFTLTILTSQRGRSFRGRNYIGGLTEALVTANAVGGTHIQNWITAYTQLKSDIDALNRFLVVVSRFSGVDGNGKPIPREEGIATIVTGFRVFDDIVDSQRRRLPGRGQ